MRAVAWLARFLAFVLLLGLAFKNTAPVEVRFFLGKSWEIPLSLVLFLFFAAGAALGIAATFGISYRSRRELDALRGASAPSTSSSDSRMGV
jgi:uncharacterized integral membrane protein